MKEKARRILFWKMIKLCKWDLEALPSLEESIGDVNLT